MRSIQGLPFWPWFPKLGLSTLLACLLGSAIGDVGTISSIIDEKVHLLGIMGDRLKHLDSHDAILLRHSFAIPKLLYTLRMSPCFFSPALSCMMRG